jgi:hypothetical protein
VSNTTYYLAWLAAGLAIIAALSAALTRRLRWRVLRRAKALELVDALACYTGWIAAQRHAASFQGDAREGESPLQDIRLIQRDWFPELAEEAAQLLEVHARLIDFLWARQMLRLTDPDAWFESDHDTRFMQLWRLHREVAQAASDRLKLLAGGDEMGMEAGSTFPA